MTFSPLYVNGIAKRSDCKLCAAVFTSGLRMEKWHRSFIEIDRGDRRLQTRLFRELSKVGFDELCAPRAAVQCKVNNKACNYYTQMAEITVRSAGWKNKSTQKINVACI